MGTAALTTVKDVEDRTIVVLYRQSDGYQDQHGQDLKTFLSDMRLVDGFSDGNRKKIANGMGCLAAQLVSILKNKAGLHYLYPEGVADKWACFQYTIYPVKEAGSLNVFIKVESLGKVLFDGLASDYPAVDCFGEF